MSHKYFTDRSRIVLTEKCQRARLLQYHWQGTGVVPKKESLYTVVGGAVHAGLARMLQIFVGDKDKFEDRMPRISKAWLEEEAVHAALMEFDCSTQDGMELGGDEAEALTPQAQEKYVQQLAESLGVTPEEAGLGSVTDRAAQVRSEFDRYLLAEQRALTEGLVRAYARRRLRPLLEQFEVMEVEREGEWKLSEWQANNGPNQLTCLVCNGVFDWPYRVESPLKCLLCGCMQRRYRFPTCNTIELWFLSRLDALLRERSSNQLFLLSYKTTGQWDKRKQKDIQHDMQGLSEGVEVERRLGEWHKVIHGTDKNAPQLVEMPIAMQNFLRSLPDPPRIQGIRYEFLLKGERWKDKELSAQLGVEARSQRSHLLRRYVAVSTPKKGQAGYAVGDVCWSWDYVKDDGADSSLSWANWKSQPIFHTDGNSPNDIKTWINMLDATEETMSQEDATVGLPPRLLGYKSSAQALGYTREHPLDAVFVEPILVLRQDDDLRDWVEQTEAQERRQVENLAQLQAATEDGERRSLMNQLWPKSRGSCHYFFGGDCPYVGVCWSVNAELGLDPLGSGQFKRRVPNHPREAENA